MTKPTASVYEVPEGYTFVANRSRETAQALLDAADAIGADQRGIKARQDGYLAPNDIAEEYESTLSKSAKKSDTPDDSWKNDDIKQYAKDNNIDLGDATVKADMLKAIDAAGNKEE